jgi:hypothetical protein
MNPNTAQILVCDHITESRRQAAAARRADAARGAQRQPGDHAARRVVHWLRSV